jgi:NADPH:quinone reductase-like Zn-dependent oxidoreductase
MKAAVVSSFGAAPRYEEFPSPTAAGDDGTVIDVIAAGLHPRVRSQANGSHYTSTGELPLVPGIDGVGRGADGLLRYFILPDTTMGAMAEQAVIDPRRSIVLPEDSDPIAVATATTSTMPWRPPGARGTGSCSPWPPSTPPVPRRSASSRSTTSTSATGG